ncbi:MAG TPA: YoaK family protein [Candidatus Dormibacteraeota bacterium]
MPAATERKLAALLLLLTAVAGLVDSVSYLQLGHTFVANMTGNIVFVGFAVAGAPGLSLLSSIIAIAAFGAGALAAGRIAHRRDFGKSELLRDMAAVELVLVALATATHLVERSPDGFGAHATVAFLAAAMGIQSAMTGRLAIRGFNSTVVLTTMLGTLAAGSRLAGGTGADNGRRALAILAMLAGALAGALVTLHGLPLAPLLVALAALAVVASAAQVVGSD